MENDFKFIKPSRTEDDILKSFASKTRNEVFKIFRENGQPEFVRKYLIEEFEGDVRKGCSPDDVFGMNLSWELLSMELVNLCVGYGLRLCEYGITQESNQIVKFEQPNLGGNFFIPRYRVNIYLTKNGEKIGILHHKQLNFIKEIFETFNYNHFNGRQF